MLRRFADALLLLHRARIPTPAEGTLSCLNREISDLNTLQPDPKKPNPKKKSPVDLTPAVTDFTAHVMGDYTGRAEGMEVTVHIIDMYDYYLCLSTILVTAQRAILSASYGSSSVCPLLNDPVLELVLPITSSPMASVHSPLISDHHPLRHGRPGRPRR